MPAHPVDSGVAVSQSQPVSYQTSDKPLTMAGNERAGEEFIMTFVTIFHVTVFVFCCVYKIFLWFVLDGSSWRTGEEFVTIFFSNLFVCI